MTDNSNILKTVTLANGAKITFEDPNK